MSEVTQILSRIDQGDANASEDLLPLVYSELRRLAQARMASERPDHTLQATALVHEAYVRLVGGSGEVSWDSRGHFFAAAAEAMRRVLVDHARERGAIKRGGDLERVEWAESIAGAGDFLSTDLLDFSEALDELASEDLETAQLVKLRVFAGMNNKEAAELLNIPSTTAHRRWKFARAWFSRRMGTANEEKS